MARARLSSLQAVRLRCEYLLDPVGVDERAPRLSWELTCAEAARRGARQSAWRIVVRDRCRRVAWDSGVVSSDRTAQVEYEGRILLPFETYAWQVRVWDERGDPSRWSSPAHWTMGPAQTGPLGTRSWSWIGPGMAELWDEMASRPCPLLRKAFTVPRRIERATLFASALGVYEVRINGKQVGDRVLCPEWTDYTRRVQYQGYDVTGMVRPGENVLGAILAPGWFAGRIGPARFINGTLRGVYGRALRFTCLLHLDLEGEETMDVASDPSWKVTVDGPIRSSDILDGEEVDARRELPGWDASGFDDASWLPVAASQGPVLTAQPCEPIRVTRELRALSVSEPAPGIFVYDLGQNMVGRVRVRLRGAPGERVRLRHAEVLNPDGTISRDSLGINNPAIPTKGAPQEDFFTCRGDGEEVFEPRFTSHGFRYVEMSGAPHPPAPEDLAGRVFHTDAPQAGVFECSSQPINRLLSAIQWTQRANMQGIPTDCPQRDERLGWAGDIQVFCETAMFNHDMAGFFTKWLRDLREGQTADGRFPDYAPHPFNPEACFSGNPGWSDAGVIIPWRLYEWYGDRRIIEQSFESARRWVDHGERENPDLVWRDAGKLLPLYYGDWLNADTCENVPGIPAKGAEVPREVYATAFFALSAHIVSRMARVLGRADEARRYALLAGRIRAVFLRSFVSDAGRIKGDTQAGYALALHFDLLPARLRPRAAARMVAALRPYGGALSTGIQSTGRLMRELSRWGYGEEAYRILMRSESPSFRSMVEHGGTTIWERWDAWVESRGYRPSPVGSFNHWAFGAVGEWIWRVVAGINPGAPGCSTVTISPVPGGGVTWCKASHHTIRGPVRVDWSAEGGSFRLGLDMPPNLSATVVLPVGSRAGVTESGVAAARAPGVKTAAGKGSKAAFVVGSGVYRFEAPFTSSPTGEPC